jgi:hypothetical protein
MDRTTARPDSTVIVRLNRRGRVVTEHSTPAKGWELPVKMLALKDGLVVLSDIRADKGKTPSQARIAWYDADGKLIHDRIFKDKNYNLEATAIAKTADKEGLVVLLHAIGRKPSNDEFSMIVRLSLSGMQLWKRDYRPGARNMLTDIRPAKTGFIASGRIFGNYGHPAGWAVRLGDDGTLMWQRSYARGNFAVLVKVAAMGQGIMLVGRSAPADGGPSAAWLMGIDDNGAPVWQRFYRRPDVAFNAAGIMAQPDGRVTILLNATAAPDAKVPNHMRMMTVSPLGVMLGDEAYVKGAGAKAFDMTEGWNGERLVTASIDMARDGETGLRYQGWVVVATALDPWRDVCVK